MRRPDRSLSTAALFASAIFPRRRGSGRFACYQFFADYTPLPGVPVFFVIIFITGGAILALELLASRIMTPYFGVSLYIWTGILSITLVSLALGYWAGGRYADGKAGVPMPLSRLVRGDALLPAVAAIGIIA